MDSSTRANQQLIDKDDLEYVEKIGHGNFGYVEKHIWHKPNGIRIPTAVKNLKESQKEDKSREMLKEIKNMQKLHHEHIVLLYGLSLGDDMEVLMVLEFCDGGSLDARLRDSKKPAPLITLLIEYSKQIADGMNYLETMRCVHRDLAARNVLLTKNDQHIKIADFGLTRQLKDDDVYQLSAGKPIPCPWMPPETLRSKLFSHSSDVWSYGVTLWEIFNYCKKLPWDGFTSRKILELLESGNRLEKPSFSTKNVYTIMSDCWHATPEKRPNFSALLKRLKNTEVEYFDPILETKTKCIYTKNFKQNNNISIIIDDLPDGTHLVQKIKEGRFVALKKRETTDKTLEHISYVPQSTPPPQSRQSILSSSSMPQFAQNEVTEYFSSDPPPPPPPSHRIYPNSSNFEANKPFVQSTFARLQPPDEQKPNSIEIEKFPSDKKPTSTFQFFEKLKFTYTKPISTSTTSNQLKSQETKNSDNPVLWNDLKKILPIAKKELQEMIENKKKKIDNANKIISLSRENDSVAQMYAKVGIENNLIKKVYTTIETYVDTLNFQLEKNHKLDIDKKKVNVAIHNLMWLDRAKNQNSYVAYWAWYEVAQIDGICKKLNPFSDSKFHDATINENFFKDYHIDPVLSKKLDITPDNINKYLNEIRPISKNTNNPVLISTKTIFQKAETTNSPNIYNTQKIVAAKSNIPTTTNFQRSTLVSKELFKEKFPEISAKEEFLDIHSIDAKIQKLKNAIQKGIETGGAITILKNFEKETKKFQERLEKVNQNLQSTKSSLEKKTMFKNPKKLEATKELIHKIDEYFRQLSRIKSLEIEKRMAIKNGEEILEFLKKYPMHTVEKWKNELLATLNSSKKDNDKLFTIQTKFGLIDMVCQNFAYLQTTYDSNKEVVDLINDLGEKINQIEKDVKKL